MTDLLLLGMGRLGAGLSVAGMTTEADPITGLRWVRPVTGAALKLDDLRYADGTLPRLGDVLRLELGETPNAPPFVENASVLHGFGPAERVRSLSANKRAGFFTGHLDPEPRAVLSKTPSRSLCLVQPDDYHATFSFDEDSNKFEARLVLSIGRLHSRGEGLLVTDVYWRALGREWLADEPFLEFDAAELRTQVGDLFVVIGLSSKGVPQVIGVHTVPAVPINLDETNL